MLLILPWLISDGMFMDGMIYSTVAKNLAEGQGSWWNLHLAKHLSDTYNDQPPLTLWITSFFFRLLGDSIYTERFYSLCTAIANLLLIRSIWKISNSGHEEKQQYWWLAVLLWIIPPACFWSFANNMQENTMSIFILLSVRSYLLFEKKKQDFKHLLLSSVYIFLAGMTKGIQGTFPLIAGIITLISFGNISISESVRRTAILLSVIVIGSVSLYFYEPARHYFELYYQKRILNTFANPDSSTTPTRFYLLLRLISEMIGPLLLIGIIRLSGERISKGIKLVSQTKKQALWFLLLAFAGTVPLMVTSEQRRFYLVPTFPLYALALATVAAGHLNLIINYLAERMKYNYTMYLAFLLFTLGTGLTISKAGSVKRDAEMIHDVRVIGKIIPPGTTLHIASDQFQEWSLHLYMKRYYDIDLTTTQTGEESNYYLGRKTKAAPENTEELPLNLILYKLYKLKP